MSNIDSILAAARLRRGLPDPPLRRLLRERAGLSQLDVAKALGVDRASVSRYESGLRAPQRHVGERYAQLLDRLAREVLA